MTRILHMIILCMCLVIAIVFLFFAIDRDLKHEMDLKNSQRQDIREHGKKSCIAGLPIESCPYPPVKDWEYTAWRLGWIEEKTKKNP